MGRLRKGEGGGRGYTCPSADQGGSMRSTDGYVTPVSSQKKYSNQNKCRCSSAGAFDQRHISGFRVGVPRTPERTWNRICINTARGGMCE